jgi:hypothetical protein
LLKKIDRFLLSLWWGAVILALGCGFLSAQQEPVEAVPNLSVAPTLSLQKIGFFSKQSNLPLTVGLLADTSLITGRMIDQKQELRSQYSLAYMPEADATEGFRRIRVNVRKKDLPVQARDGYYAPSKPAAE